MRIYIYIYVYLYTYIDRERDIDTHMYIYIYIYSVIMFARVRGNPAGVCEEKHSSGEESPLNNWLQTYQCTSCWFGSLLRPRVIATAYPEVVRLETQ